HRPGRRPSRHGGRRSPPRRRRGHHRSDHRPGRRRRVAHPRGHRSVHRPYRRRRRRRHRADPSAAAHQPAAPDRHHPPRHRWGRRGPPGQRHPQGGHMTPIVAPRPARRLPALLWAAGYGLGIPALLGRAAGWPLPRRLPTLSGIAAAFGGQWRPDDHFVISALAVIAWAVWAQIGAVTLSEVRTIRSGRPGRGVPWSTWCRPIALRLATTLAVLAPLAPRAAGATPLPIGRSAVQAVAVSSAPARSAQPPGIQPSVAPVQMATVVHIVRPDETLWDIARTQLGDPRRWRELFDLNRDRPQPDGRRLENQDLLRPGWRI